MTIVLGPTMSIKNFLLLDIQYIYKATHTIPNSRDHHAVTKETFPWTSYVYNLDSKSVNLVLPIPQLLQHTRLASTTNKRSLHRRRPAHEDFCLLIL